MSTHPLSEYNPCLRLGIRTPSCSYAERMGYNGMPCNDGKGLALVEMEAAIAQGPHELALSPDALGHFQKEVSKKVMCPQVWVVEREATKLNPSKQLKISPVAAIPCISKAFW